MRWAGAAALLPMFLLAPAAPRPGELRVTVLDVGQGLAVVLQTADHALLYDTGPRYSEQSDSGKRVILPFLLGQGIQRLDALVLSHDDNDHTGGAMSVMHGIDVGWLLSSLPPGQGLLANGHRKDRCHAGQSWAWDGVKFEILHPTLQSYTRRRVKDNNRSCVIKVTSAYGRLLLTGDIERLAELSLLESGVSLESDVVVVPHHGSKTSSIRPFVAAISPDVAIFSAGHLNRFGHPKPEVVSRYQESGSRIYRNDEHGAVMVDFLSNGGIAHRSWRQAAPKYWH